MIAGKPYSVLIYIQVNNLSFFFDTEQPLYIMSFTL